MNEYQPWVRIVAQIGFPIVIALWLILRADPAIQATSRSMIEHKILSEARADISVQVLRMICRSVAKTEFMSLECDR